MTPLAWSSARASWQWMIKLLNLFQPLHCILITPLGFLLHTHGISQDFIWGHLASEAPEMFQIHIPGLHCRPTLLESLGACDVHTEVQDLLVHSVKTTLTGMPCQTLMVCCFMDSSFCHLTLPSPSAFQPHQKFLTFLEHIIIFSH